LKATFLLASITTMKTSLPSPRLRAVFLLPIFLCLYRQQVNANWQRDDTTIAWRVEANVLWQFSFDPAKGKPFFNPLTAGNGVSLTSFKPEDHPWHYGFWFSWKYINHVNYWEEDRATGKAEGATRWTTPEIKTQSDGAATIQFNVTYTNPSNRVDMTESRELKISAPRSDGSYTIDWRAKFTAGKAGAILDRTSMPGEPDGKVNGGYAGLGLRMASAPLTMSVMCSTGLVTHFESDRARPNAAAVGCNFSDGTNFVGGIAIFNDPKNIGDDAWYLINSDKMRFVCAAILAPKILTLNPGEKMSLHYRITVRRQPWTPEALE
jgi:Methane oxygenase PmoA